jgi:small-conductance mechanosensitive channel
LAAFQRRRRIRPVADGPRGEVSFTPWLGMILTVSSFFLYAASGLIAPWWAIVVMLASWLVLFILCCAWWSKHPKRLVWIGVAHSRSAGRRDGHRQLRTARDERISRWLQHL